MAVFGAELIITSTPYQHRTKWVSCKPQPQSSAKTNDEKLQFQPAGLWLVNSISQLLEMDRRSNQYLQSPTLTVAACPEITYSQNCDDNGIVNCGVGF
jgi:hypothetical protein